MRAVGVIQARASSTRLPGKVLRELAGRPMLAWQLERLAHSRTVATWVVATSDAPADDAVVAVAAKAGVRSFRGPLDGVLDRYYHCAREHATSVVLRVTADCPLHHPDVVDFVMDVFLNESADYCTNTAPPVGEDGFDAEAFTFAALERAWRDAASPYDREHVTSVIRRDESLRRVLRKYRAAYDYKLSVDTEQDFRLVEKVVTALGSHDPLFTIDEVMTCLAAHPEWGAPRVLSAP